MFYSIVDTVDIHSREAMKRKVKSPTLFVIDFQETLLIFLLFLVNVETSAQKYIYLSSSKNHVCTQHPSGGDGDNSGQYRLQLRAGGY